MKFWVGLGLLVSGFLLAQITVSTDYYQEVGPHTVMITNPGNANSGGTGFAVKAKSGITFVVSNAHVCKVEKDGYVMLTQDTLSMRGKIVSVSEITDLCLIEGSPKLKGLKLASTYRIGEPIVVLGHPWLNPLTEARGRIKGRNIFSISYCHQANAVYYTMEFGNFTHLDCLREVESLISDTPVFPGNSGSAAVNTSGDVVGVVFAGGWGFTPTGEMTNTSLIIPLERLREFLADY